ncbi:unnamed protein product [Chrysodeixis includens]|uniref:J domain-containing protein n=1 Tax=Chrysodeixis includens TaxID=689277 RepID=A0A9N8L0B4_CHRIL|nr:unnamed protein product [Chrysodeixis includens]
MGLLEMCEKYFETNNLYEILGIPSTATDKEVKKAYHKMSLKVHPDRVDEGEKLEATEKFKVLGGIHAILSDTNRRALYDESGIVDDDECDVIIDRDWTSYWRMLFKKITDDDIRAYEKEYQGSEIEREDLKQAYLNGKGDMGYITDHVQFARGEHEPRFRKILDEMIKNGEIPSYRVYTHEPESKRRRRLAKEKREAKEAHEIFQAEEERKKENSLANLISQNQQKRSRSYEFLIDTIAAKYGASKPKAKTRTSKRQAAKSEEVKPKRRRN